MKIKLWAPSSTQQKNSYLAQFMGLVNKKYNQSLLNYTDIYEWSVQQPTLFWKELADFVSVTFTTEPTEICDHAPMPRTAWFKGATLNYAQNCLQNRSNDLAIYDINETGLQHSVTWQELYDQVSKWHSFFKSQGIQKGDRIAGILPNNLTAVLAMLGATSLGAIWSSCSPDFGEQGIGDRLTQIQPTCIISLSTYLYKGKTIDIANRLQSIKNQLKTARIWVNVGEETLDGWTHYSTIQALSPSTIDFVACDFQDPLFILFSSGTTGKPKCIVHSVGGTLLQHKKEHQLHCDMRSNDTLFYYTTCGWMMWNWMVSALASGVSIVLFDGAALSNQQSIWDLIEPYHIDIFGCSASFIGASEKRKINLKEKLSGQSTRLILSTGSPLLSHHYEYLYNQFEYPIQVGSISGGTDIISCFALCNPISPVYQGRLQGRGLGMDVASYTESGIPCLSEKGDLVCLTPAPCMPIYFLDDSDQAKYLSAYFKDGAVSEWYHGDYVIIYNDGSLEILGRSDATLNPGGIRIGTAEFYEILDGFSAIQDALVSAVMVDNDEKIVLFVKLAHQQSLTPELKKQIRNALKEQASPRHMPQMIIQVNDIPYTKNGKKCELNVKRILRGDDFVIQKSSLLNEDSFDEYIAFAHQLEKD